MTSGASGLKRVYPRVCGGAICCAAVQVPFAGLSPRVRGSLSHPHGESRIGGSIPACAGEPQGSESSRSPIRVYPRVCGGAHLSPFKK